MRWVLALSVLIASLLAAALWAYTPDRPRAVLQARYPGDDITVAGIRLRVIVSGPESGRAVILLHGFGSSLDTWNDWAAILSRTCRVIRFDLPGFGLTGPDPTGDYSDQRAIVIIAALMDRLLISRATIIGNSLGGKIAWGFAAAHPDRVTSLVLISPDGFASPGFEYGKAPKIPFMARLLPYTLPRPLVRLSLAPAYGDRKRLTDATVSRYTDLMRAPGDRAAMIARMGQVMLRDPTPLLRRVTAPTLLLWGEQDGMIPFANAADYLRALPHATLVPLPGLGHVPFEEAPDESIAPVLRFLGL